MHGSFETVESSVKGPKSKPHARLEVFRQLVQREQEEGLHQWQLHRQRVRCAACGKRIKSCSTHAEISSKKDALCPGVVTKTLEQLMQELVDDTSNLPDEQEGHKWYLKESSFGRCRCWLKLPRRCGKQAVQSLQARPCHFGKVQEAALNLRSRIHLQS